MAFEITQQCARQLLPLVMEVDHLRGHAAKVVKLFLVVFIYPVLPSLCSIFFQPAPSVYKESTPTQALVIRLDAQGLKARVAQDEHLP